MIRPVIEYGHLLYDNCTSTAANSLEKFQRKAAIACTGAYKHTSYLSLLSELNWETLASRRRLYKLITYYKITNNIYPSYLSDRLPKPPPPTNYNLRNTRVAQPRFSRLTSSSNSFFPSTTREWNLLPNTTTSLPTVQAFKSIIRGANKFNPYHRQCSGKHGAWLARLRMGLSALNSHRYTYNLINSPICSLCHTENETTYHYFFTCPAHHFARQRLINSLQTTIGIDTSNFPNLLETLLEGAYISKNQYPLLLSVITTFLVDTDRFL